MIRQIHHVAILTRDIERAIAFYADLLGCEPQPPTAVDKPGLKLKTVLLPLGSAGTTFLQLIQPQVGAGVAELAARGEGAIFEIGLQTEDIVATAQRAAARGVPLSDFNEQPLAEPFLTSAFGNRYGILPAAQANGTRIELVQLMPPPRGP